MTAGLANPAPRSQMRTGTERENGMAKRDAKRTRASGGSTSGSEPARQEECRA